MKVDLRVKRFDPADSGGKTWWQKYEVDVHPDSTVLDSLIMVREQVDGTLALFVLRRLLLDPVVFDVFHVGSLLGTSLSVIKDYT